MTIATAPAAERLRLYRQSHRIEVDRSTDPFVDRCDHDHIRVYQVVTRRWQHDMNEVRQLEREVARVADVISIASAPLRAFERPIVIEEGPGYVVTADLEDDPPAHDHFDIWDGTESCPRCAFDTLRAEG